MLHPSQFQVNEAWIVFKINEGPIFTEADGDFNIIALMDAASCFMLGAEFVPAASVELSELESKRLLKRGQSHNQQLPKTLFVPENQVADILTAEAERNRISVVRVPEDQLLVFIGEARESFKQRVV